MVKIIFAGLIALVVGAMALTKKRESSWRIAAKRLGIDHETRSGFPHLVGRVDGYDVEVAVSNQHQTGRLTQQYTEVRLVAHRGPRSLDVVPERSRSHRELSPEARAFNELLGQPEMTVTGREPVAAALLDASTRERCSRGVRRFGVRLENGRFVARLDEDVAKVRGIVEAVHFLTGFARALEHDPDELPAKLWHNAQTEERRGLRQRCLELLLEHFPESAEGRRASDWALANGHPEAQLLAARAAGPEARKVVERLAADTRLTAGIRVRALTQLEAQLDTAELERLTREHLTSHTPPVRRWAIDSAARLDLLDPLLDLASRAKVLTASCARHLVGAFRHIGGTDVEPGLIAIAGQDVDSRAVGDACELLGQIGTARSVAVLTDLSRGLFERPAVKHAARGALERIEGRVGDVDGGRLSFVAEQATDGALSVSGDGGELTVSGDANESEVAESQA